MVAPDLRSPGAGQVITAPDPGVIPERWRRRGLRAGGWLWHDLLRNEVQQGQGSGVRAVRLHDDGLKVEEIETPSPDPGEVLVRVHAAAITRGELEWPSDRVPAIPSYELSGVVVGSGDGVYALRPFDRNGVGAEYAVRSEEHTSELQ